jgi:hypothetical protein
VLQLLIAVRRFVAPVVVLELRSKDPAVELEQVLVPLSLGVNVNVFEPTVMEILELLDGRPEKDPETCRLVGLGVKTSVPMVAVPLARTFPLKLPVCAAATATELPVLFNANAAKSLLQLAAALMSKVNFAGNMLGATLASTPPTEKLQSPSGLDD